jgi:UDP-glucose 4-epimerase
MRILITGGAGCLGTSLVDHWLPLGHEILVIDNFATGHRGSLPDHRGLTVVEGSITDADQVEQLFASFKPEWVVHSAAAYKDPDDWAEDTSTNVQGTINIVKACQRNGSPRLLHFQTALCYGRPVTVPIPVTAPVAPFTSYGISKAAGEKYIMMSGLSAVSLRLANVTGPRLAIGPIPTFYQRLKQGKDCFCSDSVRDFLDMSDFIAIVDRVLPDRSVTGVYNVSTGEGHTIKDVFDEVVAHLGITPNKPVPIVPVGADDVPAVVLDPTMTTRDLGWSAQVGFKETIRKMLKWYDAHGVTAIYSHLKA